MTDLWEENRRLRLENIQLRIELSEARCATAVETIEQARAIVGKAAKTTAAAKARLKRLAAMLEIQSAHERANLAAQLGGGRPTRLTISKMQEALAERGFMVERRTIERDKADLAAFLGKKTVISR